MDQLQRYGRGLPGSHVLGQPVQPVVDRDAPLVHLDRVMVNQEGVALDVGNLQLDGVLAGRKTAWVGPDVLAEYALAGILDILVVLVDDVVDPVDSIRIPHNQSGRLDVETTEGALDIESELHGALGEYVVRVPV